MTDVNVPSGEPNVAKSGQVPPAGARLVPMKLEAEKELQLFVQQRVICGWNSQKVPKWRDQMARGERTLFWITLPTSFQKEDTPLIRRENEPILPIGHISLDKADYPDKPLLPDESLVAPDGSVLSITTLFILPAFGGSGLGAFAMDQCEKMATQEPYGSRNCRAVTLTTLSSRYLAGGSETERWSKLGWQMPERDNAIWYKRRGYVIYKEELRYFQEAPDGTTIEWFAQFMRKELWPDTI